MIEYPKIFDDPSIMPYIIIEITFIQKSYPMVKSFGSSYIEKTLEQSHLIYEFNEYELPSFEINVQTLERTFIDKVFAICDYYELKKETRESRHLYDLFKICSIIDVSKYKDLVEKVRSERKNNPLSISAKDNYNVNNTLKRIIETNFYKNDYIQITSTLIYDEVSYHQVIETLKHIIDLNIF